jgi:hypothetical protein
MRAPGDACIWGRMNEMDLEILRNAMPGNETPPPFAVKLLEDTCTRTGLDWKMRHVYLMKRGGKWGVTLSIDGFRLVGAQDDDYVGQEGPFWVTASDGTWTDIPPETAIYAAKVGIKHKNGTTTWGVAKYKDYAAGPMWSKFPSTMIAKCAEMLAWRKAMPGRLGGLYGVEEMEQAGFTPKKQESAPATSGYREQLSGATSLSEVLVVGQKINADKTLGPEEAVALHALYTAQKAKYAT